MLLDYTTYTRGIRDLCVDIYVAAMSPPRDVNLPFTVGMSHRRKRGGCGSPSSLRPDCVRDSRLAEVQAFLLLRQVGLRRREVVHYYGDPSAKTDRQLCLEKETSSRAFRGDRLTCFPQRERQRKEK